ncbi:hypothetical protein BH11BAC2_BH11BAC2_14840 [soil metagenome]
MQLVTLTTDWGNRDHHVGALKGLLYSACPQVTIVDISHKVSHHNIQQAAYIFKNAFRKFPENSVHIIGVNSYTEEVPELLAIKKDGHYFIGMNDGFFSLVFEEEPVDMVVVEQGGLHYTYYELETVTYAASHLLMGNNVYELGSRPGHYEQKKSFLPVIEEEVIRGVVIYIDDFGNVVTNIHKSLFDEQKRDRKFEIVARKMQHTIDEISERYSAVEPGGAVSIFNAAGYLEIAINQDSASKLLGLKLNDNIRIEFK